jgi:putative ABC transport system permease protein
VRLAVETVAQDLRFALRQLRRTPGLTAAVALTLGLALGANVTIFTLLKAVFLNPVPAAEPARVVNLFRTFEQPGPGGAGAGGGGLLPTSYRNYEDFRDRAHLLSGLAAYTFGQFNLSGGGEPEQVGGEFASGNYFEVLGIEPARGPAGWWGGSWRCGAGGCCGASAPPSSPRPPSTSPSTAGCSPSASPRRW